MTPRRRILPIFVPHAGCPNQCVFCDQKRISGSLFPASGAQVRQALEGLGPGPAVELAFYGGSFTAVEPAVQEELLAAAEPYRRQGRVAAIRVSTRPDAVDGPALARLRRWGVGTVELGAQSMDDGVLALCGRGHTAGDTVRAAALVREGGFSLILQMMTGLPGSGEEQDLETARRLADLRPDGMRIYPTVVLRGTELEAMWRRGEYREHTVEDAVRVCARILPLLEERGIPVIRLGLNPTQELSEGGAAAGAYHPALGELVRSRILLDRARRLLAEAGPAGEAVLGVSPARVSAMTGWRRCNLRRLEEEFSLSRVRVKACPGLETEEIRLL